MSPQGQNLLVLLSLWGHLVPNVINTRTHIHTHFTFTLKFTFTLIYWYGVSSLILNFCTTLIIIPCLVDVSLGRIDTWLRYFWDVMKEIWCFLIRCRFIMCRFSIQCFWWMEQILKRLWICTHERSSSSSWHLQRSAGRCVCDGINYSVSNDSMLFKCHFVCECVSSSFWRHKPCFCCFSWARDGPSISPIHPQFMTLIIQMILETAMNAVFLCILLLQSQIHTHMPTKSLKIALTALYVHAWGESGRRAVIVVSLEWFFNVKFSIKPVISRDLTLTSGNDVAINCTLFFLD